MDIRSGHQDGFFASPSPIKKKKMVEVEERCSPRLAAIKRPRIKENARIESQFCGICLEDKMRWQMFTKTSCTHSFCIKCISAHVSAKISDGVAKVNCPEPECIVKLEPRNCKSFFPKRVIERWENMKLESEMGSKRMYRPYRDCSAVVVGVEDQERDVTSAKCLKCNRLFSQCREDDMDKKFMEIAHKENWKKCPNCKFYVQKSWGCASIKCRCGSTFCYDCGYSYSIGHVCRRTHRLHLARNWEFLMGFVILFVVHFCLHPIMVKIQKNVW